MLFVASLLVAAHAFADLPVGRTVSYDIHATPSNPNSFVQFKYDIHITPKSQSGNSIAWGVDSVTIREYNSAAQLLGTWIDGAPVVHTADGRWWVTHSDPENPTLSEFIVTPKIDGNGASGSFPVTTMDYSSEGTSQSQSVYNPGGINTIYIRRHWEESPAFDDDEPVVVSSIPDIL